MVSISKKKEELKKYNEEISEVVSKETLEKAENTLKEIFNLMEQATKRVVKKGSAYEQPEMITAGKFYDSLELAKLLDMQLKGEIIDVEEKIKEYLLNENRILARLEKLYSKEGLPGMLRNLSNLLSKQPHYIVDTLIFEREKEKLLQELKEVLKEYPYVDFKALVNLLLERYKINVEESASEEEKLKALVEALKRFSLEKFTSIYESAQIFKEYYEKNKDKIKDEAFKKLLDEINEEITKLIDEYESFTKYAEKNIYTELQIEKSPIEILKAHVKFYLNYYAVCIELYKKLSKLGELANDKKLNEIKEITPGTVELNVLLQQTLIGLSPLLEKLINDNNLQILINTFKECVKESLEDEKIEKIIEDLKSNTSLMVEANNKIRYIIAKYINEKSGEKLYSVDDNQLMNIINNDEELRKYLIEKLNQIVNEISGADLESVSNLAEIFTPAVIQEIKQELIEKQKQKIIEKLPDKVAKLEAENIILKEENKELRKKLENMERMLGEILKILKEKETKESNEQ